MIRKSGILSLRAILVTVFLLIILSGYLSGQNAGIRFVNQASAWLGAGLNDPFTSQAGALYLPGISPYWKTSNGKTIDAEFSVKAFGNLLFDEFSLDTTNHSLKPYRFWLRYSGSRFELRGGLQKINFGSGTILRPLMWFDRMDYRDPLQLTNGVWSLLARYYFTNNANIWLWTLYGNDELKGWEIAPSVRNIPEVGGRFQLPVPAGELGLSYHHRTADYTDFYYGIPITGKPHFSEDQLGVDGKWDIGAGLSIEYVKKMNDKENTLMGRWETYYSIGLDYTFPWGNGLYALTEYFHYSNTPPDGQEKSKSNYSALSLSYPIFLTHNLSGVVYYNYDKKEWSRFINFQLKYDYLSFYIMAFWNPDTFSLYSGADDSYFFAGKGFQVMISLDI